MSKRKKKRGLVSQKISVLRHEDVPEKQAVAMAMNMGREGRLREGGKYVHKHKGRRSKRSHRN